VREYETTFIIQPELSDEGVAQVCARVEDVLEKQGAIKLFYDDMGKRRLAYAIKTFQKGHYLTLFYLDEGKAIGEIERTLRLDESVLRFLTVLGNPKVVDVAARKAEAVELERIRAEKAAERAQRDAEEVARVAEEEAERQAALAAKAEENAAAAAKAEESAAAADTTSEAAAAEKVEGDAATSETVAGGEDGGDAAAEAPATPEAPSEAGDAEKKEG
jgi:small subunit ribosomal protein S6